MLGRMPRGDLRSVQPLSQRQEKLAQVREEGQARSSLRALAPPLRSSRVKVALSNRARADSGTCLFVPLTRARAVGTLRASRTMNGNTVAVKSIQLGQVWRRGHERPGLSGHQRWPQRGVFRSSSRFTAPRGESLHLMRPPESESTPSPPTERRCRAFTFTQEGPF